MREFAAVAGDANAELLAAFVAKALQQASEDAAYVRSGLRLVASVCCPVHMLRRCHPDNVRLQLKLAHHAAATSSAFVCHAAAQQAAEPSTDAAQSARTANGSAEVRSVQPVPQQAADAEPRTAGAASNGQQQAANGGSQGGGQPEEDGRPASRGPRMSRTLVLEPIADKARECA